MHELTNGIQQLKHYSSTVLHQLRKTITVQWTCTLHCECIVMSQTSFQTLWEIILPGICVYAQVDILYLCSLQATEILYSGKFSRGSTFTDGRYSCNRANTCAYKCAYFAGLIFTVYESIMKNCKNWIP